MTAYKEAFKSLISEKLSLVLLLLKLIFLQDIIDFRRSKDEDDILTEILIQNFLILIVESVIICNYENKFQLPEKWSTSLLLTQKAKKY